ncbi:hypothetical protein F66182_5427 [Fusarium sp. NRRL 66182]|nr:hypothetical protein F66182_5427 [Fusarium sp. NRRL 66182]
METNVLLALCSKLERLTIHITDSEGKEQRTNFDLLHYLGRNHGTISGLAGLGHLEINTNKCNRFSIGDTEVPLFLQQSHRLETLVLRGPEGNRLPDDHLAFAIQRFQPGLQNLTRLQITSWSFFGVERDSYILGEMVKMAKNLTSFTFSTDSDGTWGNHHIRPHHIPPARFIKLLKPLEGTLQDLSLDFDSKIYASSYQSPDLMTISPQQIHKFARLESLKLDISCYCRHVFGRKKIGSSFDQKTCLTDLLPLTVRNLSILFSEKGWWECLPDFLYLGERVKAGEFPNLQRVRIDAPVCYETPCSNNWDDEWDNKRLGQISDILRGRKQEFKAAFAGSKVDVGFHSWFIWESMY